MQEVIRGDGNRTPQAVQACHELLVWIIPRLDAFPRARRFTLRERLEAGLLEALVDAAYRRVTSTRPRAGRACAWRRCATCGDTN